MLAFAIWGWVLLVAPLFYVTNLITAAPIRNGMRNRRRLIYSRQDWTVDVQEWPAEDPLPEAAVDISLSNQSFAFTNTINAGVLFLAKWIVEHYH